MKKVSLLLFFFSLSIYSFAQLSISTTNTNFTIDFDNTVADVGNSAFDGSGFTVTPATGELDADAWAFTGFSTGSKDFGVANNASGDYTRGSSTGGETSGGVYAFDVSNGGAVNRALGFQGTGSDFTPGTMALKITNNTGQALSTIDISYDIFEYNDQGRSTSLNFSYSSDNSTYTDVAALDHATTQALSGSPTWVSTAKTTNITGLSIANGASFYIKWSSNDAGGSGSRDEVALDNIVISGSANSCTAPTTQATSFATANITNTALDISFTRGNGDGGVLVLAKAGSAVDASPVSGTTYVADAAFGSGDQVGTGNFVVYNSNAIANSASTGNISISALMEATDYHFAVFEYGATGVCYNTTALSGNATTTCGTPVDVNGESATSESMQSIISWTLPTCYDEILVVAKSGSSVTNTPSGDGTAYTADAAFGSGTDLGAGEFVVYKGTGMTETVTALTNGTQYFFTIFTRKGTSWSAGVEIDVTPSNEVCEAFDNGSTLPTGWSGAGISQYSTGNFSPKSLKFDDTGDVLTSPQTTNATGFSFYIKGNSTSGSYSFLVEGFDGTTFTTIEDITAVTSNYVQKTYTGLPNYQGFRLTYANKASGNMAVDDICISADAISVTPTPLPVELISFNANPTNEGIQLTWKTATELNNDYFIVQKSVNGKTFEDLGQVAGAGTTTEVQSYGFLDVTPVNGTNYYRLKQVDFDGKFEYSNVISVETEKGLTAVDIYPNPSAGRYNVELSDNWTTQTTLEVFDMTGRLVYSKNVQNNVSELNLEHLSNGSYFLRLTNESDVFTTRIVKTK